MLFSPQILVRRQPQLIVAAGLGLQTNLNGFWSFETGSWTDDTAFGSTLTAGGTPTSTSGKVGNALTLAGTTDYLTCTSNANLVSGGGSFSVQAWVKMTAITPSSDWSIFNKDNNSFGQREWGLGSIFSGTNVWCFRASSTNPTSFGADSAVTVATGSWVHLVGTFNSSGGAMVIYVNGSASGSGGTLTGTMNSTASAPLNIGRQVGSIMPACQIDQCGFWKGRVLSASDVTALYNSGNGLSYAAML